MVVNTWAKTLFFILSLCGIDASPTYAGDPKPRHSIFDLRSDAPKDGAFLQSQEKYALVVYARKQDLLDSEFGIGHIWIEWCNVEARDGDKRKLIPIEGWGWYPKDDKAIACAFKCEGEMRNDLARHYELGESGLYSVTIVLDDTQFRKAKQIVDDARAKAERDASGKKSSKYGIVHLDKDVKSCRGFVKEILEAAGLKLKGEPGLKTPVDYLGEIQESLRDNSVMERSRP